MMQGLLVCVVDVENRDKWRSRTRVADSKAQIVGRKAKEKAVKMLAINTIENDISIHKGVCRRATDLWTCKDSCFYIDSFDYLPIIFILEKFQSSVQGKNYFLL